jgi:ABC-2 type transport system permease protein
MRPFVDLRWWPFALLVALAIGLMVLAAWLESRRQYDDGTIPSAGERPNARPIPGVFALHLTLQRGQTIGWSVGLFLAGLAFGSMTKSLLDTAKGNELLARMLEAQGNDGVYTTMTQFLAAAATAYVVGAVLRVYGDEQKGLGEAVLAGAISRWRWLLTAVASALVGATVLMFFAGLGNGLGAGMTLGEPQTVVRLTLAGLAFVPAMAVLAGIAALAVALRHAWIGWLAVTFVVVSLYLGALLRLPRWLIDLSPVGRTTAPTDFPAAALAVMVVAAAVLAIVAGWIYRSRDAA